MATHIRKGLLLTLCLFVIICVTSADIRSSQRSSNTAIPTRTVPTTRKSRSTIRVPTVRIPNNTRRPLVTFTKRKPVTLPTTRRPTVHVPITRRPTTHVPNTRRPSTHVPITRRLTTHVPNTRRPTTHVPNTRRTTIHVPNTRRPSTQVPTTRRPTTHVPNITRPTTQVPNTRRPTTQVPSTKIRISGVTGQLEANYVGDWFPIQWNAEFSTPYLKVLCRSMGRPTDFVTAKEGPKTYKTVVSLYLTCSGKESSVSDCMTHNTDFAFDTTSSSTILLSCTGISPELKYGTHNSGLVATWYQTFYVPFCVKPENFDNRGAQVVCHGLGLPSAHAINIYPNQFGRNSVKGGVKINLVCPNATSPATQCRINTPTDGGFCSSFDDDYILAAVTCSNQIFEYRLTSMSGYSDIGRLEVKGPGKDWGTVCASSSVDTRNHFAEVACKSLNLTSSGAHAYTDVFYGGNITSNLYQGICNGDEDGVGNCAKIMWGKSCEKGGYIGLRCAKAYEGQLRVTGLNGGLVQVYMGAEWRPIDASDHSKRLQVAVVVCRTLNLSTNVVGFKMSENAMNLGLPSVKCSGDEVDFSHCNNTDSKHVYWFSTGKALYIQCDSGMESMRLEKDGLLEVKRNGVWGTVCGKDAAKKEFFTNSNASKICSYLNKPSSFSSVIYKSDTQRSGPITVSGLKCNSANQNISCKFDTWTNPDCGHNDDVYIHCGKLNRSLVQYRLKTDFFPNVGIFEMSINGVWGAVVRREGDFLPIAEEVFCRSINNTLPVAKSDNKDVLKMRMPVGGKVWLDHVQCWGYENSPLDCQHMYIGDYEHTADIKPVTLYCGPHLEHTNFALQLVGDTRRSGRLEVYMYGTWAPVCALYFNSMEAKVACSKLGFTGVSADASSDRTFFGRKAWPAKFDCDGFESSLEECDINPSFFDCGYLGHVKLSCEDIVPFIPPQIPIIPDSNNGYSTDDWGDDDYTWGSWNYVGITGGSGLFILLICYMSFLYRRRRNNGATAVQRSQNYVHLTNGGPITHVATTEQTLPPMLPMQVKGTRLGY